MRPWLRFVLASATLCDESTTREADVIVKDGQLRVKARDVSSRLCNLTGTALRKGSLNARCPASWNQENWELLSAHMNTMILKKLESAGAVMPSSRGTTTTGVIADADYRRLRRPAL